MSTSTEATRDVTDLLNDLFALMRERWTSVASEFDLTPPQLGVLTSLDEPTAMSRLASALRCDASNVTWMTDRLEERGLVERSPDAHDRRVKRLVLTDAGRKLRRVIDRRLRSGLPGLERLSPEDRRTLGRLLERVLEA